VGGRRELAAPADPGEAAGLDHLDQLRKQGRVAAAPDEARSQGHGLEPVAVGVAGELLRLRLGRRVGSRGVRPQRSGLVDVDERLAGHQRRLGAAVDEALDAGARASVERVPCPLDVAALEVLPAPGVAEVGGEMKSDLTAGGSGGDRVGVADVPAHGLCAEPGNRPLRGIGAGEGAHPPTLIDQAPHQPAADEARASGYERARHLAILIRLPGRTG
jgi:hypothetical protein